MKTLRMILVAAAVTPGAAGALERGFGGLAPALEPVLEGARRGRLAAVLYKEAQSPGVRFRALVEAAAARVREGREGKVEERWHGISRRTRRRILERGSVGLRRTLVVEEIHEWAHRIPVFTMLTAEFMREGPQGDRRWVADEHGRYPGDDPAGFMLELAFWEKELGLARIGPLEAR